MECSKLEYGKYGLIIPFCDKDIDDLIFNLNIWKRENHKIDNKNIKYNIDLIIIYSGLNNHDKYQEYKSLIYKNLNDYDIYFNNIIIDNIVLTKDEDCYPYAAAVTFFTILFKYNYYECIYYCETDCLPVKNNWLNKLWYEFEDVYIHDIWLKGNKFPSEYQTIPIGGYNHLHINGNAFFRVKPNDSIELFKEIYKYILLKPNYGYDVGIYDYLEKIKLNVLKYNLKDKIKFTLFLINFGKCFLNINVWNNIPNETYFFHGKQCIQKLRDLYKK